MFSALSEGKGVSPLNPIQESEVSQMAIYHCTISNVSRAAGSSSCATLSYISADKVYEERTAQTYSYGREERVLEVGTLIPEYAPEKYKNPAVLFNSIENYEKAENARPAKKIEVALPREFDLERQKEVVESYIRANLTEKGYCATYAIHNDKDNNNPHAHILIANRRIDKELHDWEKTKTRKEYLLDKDGNKIPVIDPETGKQKVRVRKGKGEEKLWQRISVTQNPLDKKEFLEQLRESWAVECNKHLEPEQQIDHRSYAEQGIDQIPTIHEGYASRQIEARGGVSDRAEINREIKEKNSLIKQLTEQLRELGEKLKEKGAQTIDRIGELLQRSRNARVAGGLRSEHSRQGTPSGRERDTSGEDYKARADRAISDRANRESIRERLAAEKSAARERELAKKAERAATRSRDFDGPSL